MSRKLVGLGEVTSDLGAAQIPPAPALGKTGQYTRGGRPFKRMGSAIEQEVLSDALPLQQVWRAALADRKTTPALAWCVGDSMTEAFGVTSDYNKWPFIWNRAIQQLYRNGGVGFIAAKHGTTWTYSTNPDGKNTWSTPSSVVDNVDYGHGLGRRTVWLNTNGTTQITVDTDRFFIHYVAGTGLGTLRVEVDPGTPFATLVDTATASLGGTWGGQIYDSGPITQGTHVVKVTAIGATVLLEGIRVFNTDANVGVQVLEGGHSGYAADNFDASQIGATNDGFWADNLFQPAAPAQFNNGVGNGTTTFTSATAAFSANDVGEYIAFPHSQTNRPTNGVAKIVSVTNSTTVVLDRVVASQASMIFKINRSQVTDMVTNATTTITSATAAFTAWDRGRPVLGTNIPAGTYIRKVNSATSVTLSAAATGSGSGGTLRILNRQRFPTMPKLVVLQFGINDQTFAVQTAAYKQQLKNIFSLIRDRSCQDVSPSVALLDLWAPYAVSNMGLVVDTTNGSPVITSAEAAFTAADVGKTITTTGNNPIPAATTIASVQSLTQATLSQNAIATTTGNGATINSRVRTNEMWEVYRTAQLELAAEMGWELLDLYPAAGYVGAGDPLGISVDGVHPNDNGSQLIADLLNIKFAGIPRNASIPEGIFDTKGDLIVAAGVDDAQKFPVGQDGTNPTARLNAPLGLTYERGFSAARLQAIYADAKAGATASVTSIGLPAPTQTATASAVNDADGPYNNHATTNVSGNPSGLISQTFDLVRPGWVPEFYADVKLVDITAVRILIGLFSANPDAANPGTLSGAWFRYDTGLDGTAFWRTCTGGGAAPTAATTTAAVTASIYGLRIEFVGTRGQNPTAVRFWINGALVAQHTATLPTANTQLGYGIRVVTLAAAIKNLKWARMALSGAA